jgi:metal-dependent amidase/aminoacylase/carboxypeptidase family protein
LNHPNFRPEALLSIIRPGCSNPEKGITRKLHSPRFDIDEDALEIGTNIFFEVVSRRLDTQPGSSAPRARSIG